MADGSVGNGLEAIVLAKDAKDVPSITNVMTVIRTAELIPGDIKIHAADGKLSGQAVFYQPIYPEGKDQNPIAYKIYTLFSVEQSKNGPHFGVSIVQPEQTQETFDVLKPYIVRVAENKSWFNEKREQLAKVDVIIVSGRFEEAIPSYAKMYIAQNPSPQ